MDNFLSASPLLVTHLQQQITTVPALNIRPAVSIDWAIKNALAPSVNIIWIEEQPDTGPGGVSMQGKSQLSMQFWLVLLSMRNVADAGTAAQNDIGKLIISMLKALQGHRLSPDHQPLHRQKCVFRKTDKDGIAHIPFMFSTQVITTGSAVSR